jgi:Xaa-Pro aminopeptidase
VTLEGAHLFVDPKKIADPSVMEHLMSRGIILHSYESAEEFIGQQAVLGKVLVDPTQLNWQLYQAIERNGSGHKDGATVEMASPITLMKSLKNSAELAGVRACHVRDGAALTAFLCWLETAVKTEGSHVTEYDVAVKIEEFRKKAGKHLGPSFDTIAGFAGNGAIIHYKPEKSTAAVLCIGDGSMFLLDSGAQYLDGTTDVTRTLHFGTPSAREKMCYTLVLQVTYFFSLNIHMFTRLL